MRWNDRLIPVAFGLAASASLLGQAPPPPPLHPGAAAQALARPQPLTYGTSAASYVVVSSAEFLPPSSSYTYASISNGVGTRYGTSGSITVFNAGIHLPSGAQPVSLELNFVDTSASDSVYGSFVQCDSLEQSCDFHPAAGAGPGDCLVGGYICSGFAFNGGASSQSADLKPDAITIDNSTKSYKLYVQTNSGDSNTQIAGMRVGYVLQVSPDPAFATFADVPIGNPYHRFVEALYASGITGGCGSGNFCPNDPLTRGQMAVFLSVALGLQWP